jgi:hypothetical protein
MERQLVNLIGETEVDHTEFSATVQQFKALFEFKAYFSSISIGQDNYPWSPANGEAEATE